MAQPSDHQPFLSPSDPVVTISSQLMIAAVIFLFMVILFIFFLYLYAKHYMGSNPNRLRRSRARFVFDSPDMIHVPRRGLDPEILKSLPITVFSPSQFKDGLECAVCLSELSKGEEARLLPKCNHGFHVECIDMWFHSHSTCPLCRAPVALEPKPLEVQAQESQSLNFPTSVLFYGNQEGTSSSSLSLKRNEGMLVIDIPRRGMEDIVSPLPTSRFPVEEMKSPTEERTPRSAGLRSFKRLLSRGKMVMGSSYSPRGGDIEQGLGEGSSLTPRTPSKVTV